MSEHRPLKRSVSLPFLILYGLGTMVGGGIYALTGKVAGEAGMYTPWSFLVAGLLALISAFSFAELSSRYPFSAGESRYVHEAFQKAWLSSAVGWLVILTGVISAATLVVATISFLQDLVNIPHFVGICVLVAVMFFVASWGINQSVMLVTVITIIEIGALLYVLAVSGDSIATLSTRLPDLLPSFQRSDWIPIFSGGFLAFYAFLGFEDLVNIAEEVKDVRRSLPVALIVSLILTTLFYMAISLVAVLAVSPTELSKANTPLALVVGHTGWYAAVGITVVSFLTGINGALVQIIMASRVTYGMASQSQAPKTFSTVHPKTQTPFFATAVISLFVLLLALFFPLVSLAKATSAIILIIFTMVNLSLWVLKRHPQYNNTERPNIPIWLPIVGFFSCLTILLFQAWQFLAPD